MLRKIDRVGNFDIQKITKPNGEFMRYQVVPSDMVGKVDTTPFKYLSEARQFAAVATANNTEPK